MLPEHLKLMVAGRNWTKPDVLQQREDDLLIAFKTYNGRWAWLRHSLGRWLIRREAKAYEAAAGVEGLPSFLGCVGTATLALEWIDGSSLAALGRGTVQDEVFDEVGKILSRLHARGVAVGDLHHRNVLITPGGRVVLVDLAASWISGSRSGPLRKLIFKRLVELDRLALARMRARFTGGDSDDAVRASSRSIRVWYARGRRIKRILNRLRRRR